MKKRLKSRSTAEKLVKYLRQKVAAGKVLYYWESYVDTGSEGYILKDSGKEEHNSFYSLDPVCVEVVEKAIRKGRLRGRDIRGLLN